MLLLLIDKKRGFPRTRMRCCRPWAESVFVMDVPGCLKSWNPSNPHRYPLTISDKMPRNPQIDRKRERSGLWIMLFRNDLNISKLKEEVLGPVSPQRFGVMWRMSKAPVRLLKLWRSKHFGEEIRQRKRGRPQARLFNKISCQRNLWAVADTLFHVCRQITPNDSFRESGSTPLL